MLTELIPRTAHSGVAKVEPWHGLKGDAHVRGLLVSFSDGSAFGLQVVMAASAGGKMTGPVDYDPAAGPGDDVTAVGADSSPTQASAFADYLTVLVGAAGHPEVAKVTPLRSSTQQTVTVELADGNRLVILFPRAIGPGGRSLPDWNVNQWGAMA
ncbi:hypothetical protein [Micromonospora carbonacea]|uniref:hypothetical protein n=1 Tax=Micromonospora carbonacea TaxID=47853 RepID=UPI00371DCFD6